MSKSNDERTYLQIIQHILEERVGRTPRSIYELPLSRRDYLFKLLRKLAVQGNADAFKLMERERRSHDRTVAMLNAARSAGLQTEYWPLIRGGVVTVPRGESIDEVVEMFERGITTEELSRLMDLARRDEFDQLREAEEIRERLEEERLAHLANPSSDAHLGPDEHTNSDSKSKLPQVRWGPPESLLPPIDLSQAPATRPRVILPPDLPPDAYPPGY